MKDEIIGSATRVLVREGLAGWSVDLVAAEAGCAKGLVHYHHGSKKALLATVASRLDHERQVRRLDALGGTGAAALDRLWRTLEEEVRRGLWAAWAALLAEPGIESPAEGPADLAAFGDAVARALELPGLRPEETRLVASALDGLQVALSRGADRDALLEGYHRLWLALLS